jgi:hypothetical protein
MRRDDAFIFGASHLPPQRHVDDAAIYIKKDDAPAS